MPTSKRRALASSVALALVATGLIAAATPGPAGAVRAHRVTPSAVPTGPFTVDMTSRESVRQFFNTVYQSSVGIPDGWSGGDTATCTPGSVTPEFLAGVLSRTNYFRTMAGVPDVTFNGTDGGTSADPNNAEAQAAAMMQTANQRLSHTWTAADQCFNQSPLGVTGSGASSLASTGVGTIGSYKIDDLMYDSGALGHRRNMLNPRISQQGAGAVPATGAQTMGALAHLVNTDPLPTRPAVRDDFIAWPPKGFVPYQVVYPRWSFSLPNTDFSGATVTMQRDGTTIPTTIRCFNPFPDPNSDCATNWGGEPGLVWSANNLADGATWPKPAADEVYTVNINNAIVNGVAQNFAYTVTVIDPAQWDKQWTAPTGPANPQVGQNSSYSFTTIPGATGYQWQTTPFTASTFSDGAENGSSNWTVVDGAPAYDPVETTTAATGNAAFHLWNPDFSAQTMTLNRTLFANANSQLSFDSKVTNFDHLEARVEVSSDGGNTWSSPPAFSQLGGNEATFSHKVVSLAAFAGSQIKLRFWLRYDNSGGGVCECESSAWFFDNIALSNIQEVGASTLSAVGASPSFSFNPPAPADYQIVVRPQFAGPTFGGFSAPLTVTATAAPGPGDNFADAGNVAAGGATMTGSNVGATKEAGEPNHAGNAGGHSVWWKWTASTTGAATVDTCASDYDTLLAVYTGNAVNALTQVATDDDSNTCGANSVQSSVTFNATAGTQYAIAVDGWASPTGTGATGNITLHVTPAVCTDCPTPAVAFVNTGAGFANVGFTVPAAAPSANASVVTGYTVRAMPSGVLVNVPATARRAVLSVANGKKQTVTVAAYAGYGYGSYSTASAPFTPQAVSINVTTAYNASDNTRLGKNATYFGQTKVQAQKTSVGIIAYIVGIVGQNPMTPIAPPVSTGPGSYTTSYTPAEQGALTAVMAKYALSPSEAQYFCVSLVGYLLALGGH